MRKLLTPLIITATLTLLLAVTAYAAPTDDITAPYDYDLRTVSGITAEQLAPYMHPETRFLASDVVRICNEEGVSAEFIATVMRWEKRPDLNAYLGWTLDGGTVYRAHESAVEGLERDIHSIKVMYLTERPEDADSDTLTGKWFNGYTVAEVSIMFNNTDFWREKITEGARNIVERRVAECSKHELS